jgi:transcription antitermination factor NusA-like protein
MRAVVANSKAKLFAQEVPEIYDGIVEVRAVARDPGSRHADIV